MKLVLQQMPNAKGPLRHPYLIPEAVEALQEVEKEAGQLIYADMWRDPVTQLLTKRLRPESPGLGYNGHSFGIGVDVVLGALQFPYDKLTKLMSRQGWYSYQKDGGVPKAGHGHFDFFGEKATRYLMKSSYDPNTWNLPVEEYIQEKFGEKFQVDLPEVQSLLVRIGYCRGPITKELDLYTREALLAFQRTWRLSESGQADPATCRALVLIASSAEFKR
jgi:hypothetical protein